MMLTRLALEWNALVLETNAVKKTRARYTLRLIGTVYTIADYIHTCTQEVRQKQMFICECMYYYGLRVQLKNQ